MSDYNDPISWRDIIRDDVRYKYKGYYNDPITEAVMNLPKHLPRYATLARKVIYRYIGDRYNPHMFDPETEIYIRKYIQGFLILKIFNKEPYDWPFIENFLGWVVSAAGFPDIPYDMAIIERGYHGIMRSELPQYHA